MSTLSPNHYKPNELNMALRIAMKAIDKLMKEKPKGGLIVNKGQDIEAKMSYKEAKLCMERIQRRFDMLGASSYGICEGCTKWDTRAHFSGKHKDFGTCTVNRKMTHRYDSCMHHSKENGGWGL